MLRKLVIQNFYSIKEQEVLDLSIAKNASDPDGRFATPIAGSEVRLPKVVVIFGANASGKTNVLRALAFLVEFLRESAEWRRGASLPFLPFFGETGLLREPDSPRTTRFSLDIDGLFETIGRVLFRYELELSPEENRVLEENLRYYPRRRSKKLFLRRKNQITTGPDFELKKTDPVRQKIRDNASVIATLAQFNHKLSSDIHDWLSAIQTNVTGLGKHDALATAATQYYNQDKGAFERLQSEIRSMDLGIRSVGLIQKSDGIEPLFYHEGLREPILLEFESHGTQRFYAEFPRLHYVLETGGIAVLDELDNDIHSLLLPEIVRRFQDKETNPKDAQLIMSCHNATLLEHLVKEEVYFTEKDDRGRTHIYGLKDVRGVRRDSNIYDKYLAGAYGAVPRVA